MFSSSLLASAQTGQATSAPVGTAVLSASGTSIGQDGYRIIGEANPKEPGQKYVYTREMPEDSKGVYWHVEGAVAIDGSPAATYPAGSLDATERAELTIVWDLASKDSPVLQLRRDNPELKTGFDVVADLAISWPFTCTGHIEYYGRTNSPGSSGDRADQFLCPNRPVSPGAAFLDDLFRYETPDCDYFIWTLKYNTVGGGMYREQWADSYNSTAGRFALYSEVPLRPYAVYPSYNPLTNLPSSNWSPVNYTPPPGPVLPQNALAGQKVLSIDVQCTGYRSILCNMSDEQHIYFTGVLGSNLAPIAVTGTAPYCRSQLLNVSTNVPAGATANTRYTWTVLAGSVANPVVSSSNSTSLDVSWVAPTGNTIRVQVQASDNSCGGPASVSNTQIITLQLVAPLPAPQNMRLTNGSCATTGTDTKSLSVDLVTGSNVTYDWQISSSNNTANAVFDDGTSSGSLTCQNCGRTPAVKTPGSGQFTASVTAKVPASCSLVTSPLAQTFNIITSTPSCPTVTFPDGLCFGRPYRLELQNTEPGALYFILVNNVQPPSASINFTPAAGGGQPSGDVRITGGVPTSFDVVVSVVGACPPVSVRACPAITVPFVPPYCFGTGPRSSGQPPVSLFPNPTSGQVEIQAN